MTKKCLLVLMAVTGMLMAAPDGELAHYPLNEGKGDIVNEAKGRFPAMTAKNSFWVSMPNGLSLLDFGGMKTSRQASLTLPSEVKLDGAFTIMLWVRAYWWKNNRAPLVYCNDATFGLRTSASHPGQLHFLVHQKGVRRATHLFSHMVLEPTRWYHVAVSFDPGKSMRIYIDGKLDAELTHQVPTAFPPQETPMYMGSRNGRGECYTGLFYSLRLFNRSLSEAEIAAIRQEEDCFPQENTRTELPAPGKEACSIREGDSAVECFEAGGMRIRFGKAEYLMHSFYSYPNRPKMRHNSLAASPTEESEPEWKPAVAQREGAATISAAGSLYSLERKISFAGPNIIRVSETIENRSGEDLGIVMRHVLQPTQAVPSWTLHGQEQGLSAGDARLHSMNPTGFLGCAEGSLGWVVEDDVLRCHLKARTIQVPGGTIFQQFGSNQIGIPAGKSCTFEYSLHLCPTTDHFDFINAVRRDWKVPVLTLNGPFISCRTAAQRSEVFKKYAADPKAFRELMQKRHMGIMTLSPGFEGDAADSFSTPEAAMKHAKDCMAIIRKANPDIKILIPASAYINSVHEDEFDVPAPAGFQWEKVTPAVTQRFMASCWKDSLLLTPKGDIRVYPLTAVQGRVRPAFTVWVYPAIGNHLHKKRMQLIDKALDEAGADGVYFDMFGFASSSLSGKWDGFSVSIGPDGTITSKFTHLGPYSAPARAQWLRKILGKGKIALTNFGAPTTRDLQTIPYFNFCEAAGSGVGHQDLDSIPPDSSGCAMNELSCPLAYGPHRKEEINAPRLMSRVRSYLRYGCLYVHTSMRNSFPDDGPTGGSYELINHMYPITPLELHRGWVKGRERIVSCVSFNTLWDRQERPRLLRFDAVGRPVDVGDAFTVTGTPGAWRIRCHLNDWREFAVVE